MDSKSKGEASYEAEFDRWLAPFLDAFQHKVRRRWAPLYLRGLLGPGDRKSIEPLAARVAPADNEQLHHFVATSRWETGPIEAVLAAKADALVGGDDAHLIIDDTGLPKKGDLSVGVGHQYCGALKRVLEWEPAEPGSANSPSPRPPPGGRGW